MIRQQLKLLWRRGECKAKRCFSIIDDAANIVTP
jgi:hypothetical protein